MKKKSLLLILTLILLIGVGVAYAYFETDAFKTEKQLFFSYMMSDEMWKCFEDEKIEEYMQKQQTVPFSNQGEITFQAQGQELESDQNIEMLNNSKISFEGKTNIDKKMAEQEISINFAQAFTVPINLKVSDNALGLQSGFLHSKYIAVRNENLKQLFEKLGLDSEEIPDKIEFSKNEFTAEELEKLEETYLTILYENLDESLFAKEKMENQTILTLKIPEQRLIEILIKILETARNDELLLSKINGIYGKEDVQLEIDEIIEDLKEIETKETNNLQIKLFLKDKKTVKIEMEFIEDNKTSMNLVVEKLDNQIEAKLYEENELLGELNVSKDSKDTDVTYSIAIKLHDEDNKETEIDLKIGYKNLSTSNNIVENYEIKILDEDAELMINYNNSINFDETLEIEELNDNNAIILNDATEEELQNLMATIYQNLGLFY